MHKIKMLLNFIMKKKTDLIQLRKNEYYNSNEYKIKNSKKVNKDAKRQYYNIETKDARRHYYVENKDDKRLYYEENKDATRQYEKKSDKGRII